MEQQLLTPAEALKNSYQRSGFAEVATAFVCPFPNCRAYAHHTWGRLLSPSLRVGSQGIHRNTIDKLDVVVAQCHACRQEVLWVDAKMVLPAESDAPMRAADMPQEIHGEYEEAAEIVNRSPRGAAALLRLAVQKLLPLLGATKKNINDQIGELVEKDILSRRVSDALDTLRVIGNEAVHPGTIDLNDDRDMAMGLFRLLNFIVEKTISEPKHAEELFAKLPQSKRDGIEARHHKAVEAPSTTKGQS